MHPRQKLEHNGQSNGVSLLYAMLSNLSLDARYEGAITMFVITCSMKQCLVLDADSKDYVAVRCGLHRFVATGDSTFTRACGSGV